MANRQLKVNLLFGLYLKNMFGLGLAFTLFNEAFTGNKYI